MILKIKNIEKETEKAISVNVMYYLFDTIKTWRTWLPKSRIRTIDANHIEVEDWLVNRITDDMSKCNIEVISSQARINNIQFTDL